MTPATIFYAFAALCFLYLGGNLIYDISQYRKHRDLDLPLANRYFNGIRSGLVNIAIAAAITAIVYCQK